MERFPNLQINGDISVKPANGKIVQNSWRYLIMGPTGAGKSNFIEALAGPSQSLSISKNQLESYTQRVTAYELVNVHRVSFPIYLIDTPGFSDSKMSSVEVVDMVRVWMADNEITQVDAILYLIPINEKRLAGTKRRTIEMLKALLKTNNNLRAVGFVTTMWDTAHNDEAYQRAEANFTQLRDEILKGFIDVGATITRFINTRNSALQVLDIRTYSSDTFAQATEGKNAPLIYQDLHERIENALHQKKAIESELTAPDALANPELKSVLEKNLCENEEILQKFIRQFSKFGDPPTEFVDAAIQLREIILTARIRLPVSTEYRLRKQHLQAMVSPVLRAAHERTSKWFGPKR